MKRNFIIGVLIGILIGTPIIFYGVSFFSKDIDSLIRVLFWLSLILIFLFSIIYLYRKNILKIFGIHLESKKELNSEFSNLIDASKSKNYDVIKSTGSKLLNSVINTYSEFLFRIWLFRITFSVLAIIGSIIIGSLAFNQNKIINSQNKLIEQQGNYLIRLNQPILDIEESIFNLKENNGVFNCSLDLMLKNFGKRSAENIKFGVHFLEAIRDKKQLNLLDYSVVQEFINPLSPDSEININTAYNKYDNGNDILILFELEYKDPVINDKPINKILFFKIPAPAALDGLKFKTSLYNATAEDKKFIEEIFLSNREKYE